MHNYWRLVQVFRASIAMSDPQDKRRKIKFIVLGLVAIVCILIPVIVGSGFLVNLMTSTLMLNGIKTMGIELVMHFITIFTLVFGINVIFNELFFSNDLEYLLPLPLRASQIAGAKFTAAFLNENLMQIMLVLSSLIGYGIAAKTNILGWIIGLFCAATLPIIPMIYCAILGLFLMYFTHFIKNRDTVNKITSAFAVLIMVGLLLGVGLLKDMDIQHYVESMANGDQTFFQIFRIVFPHIPLFMKGIETGNLLYLLYYILLNLVYIAIFVGLSELMYFKCIVNNGNGNANHGKKFEKTIKKLKPGNPVITYLKKEILILLRTPVFFLNCIGINFIWPVFIYAVLKIQTHQYTIAEMRSMYADGDLRMRFIIFLLVPSISILMTAINSIASNSISREGKHFGFMKYIPMSYKKQWDVKVWTSILITGAGVWIYALVAFIVLQIPVLHTVLFMFMSVVCISFVSNMGILIDSYQPKLIWDDEMSALRENYNTFFAMAVSMIMLLVICVGSILLFVFAKIAVITIYFIVLALLIAAHAVVFFIVHKSGVRNISEQEEA